MNFYPLPDSVAEGIGRRLVFSAACSVIDPCASEGRVLIAMTRQSRRAADTEIELDAYRAEEAAAALDLVIQGDALSTRSKSRVIQPGILQSAVRF